MQIPSNQLLRVFGSSRWLSCLIISWGIVSGLGCLIQSANGYIVQVCHPCDNVFHGFLPCCVDMRPAMWMSLHFPFVTLKLLQFNLQDSLAAYSPRQSVQQCQGTFCRSCGRPVSCQPSNCLTSHRTSPQQWLPRIHCETCHLQRLILGIVEAGTFPGMWVHITKFHSSEETGPALAMVATSTALSQVIGAPIAAGLMMMDGLRGLRG